jgi:hypothetical protein
MTSKKSGFDAADLVEFCRGLLRIPGVTTTWIQAPSDHEAHIFVTVEGFDRAALGDRDRVFSTVEKYLAEVRPAMKASDFAFNYSVLVDDDRIGEPYIPSGARQIA